MGNKERDEDEESPINRRNVLRTVGASAIGSSAIAGASNTVSAISDAEDLTSEEESEAIENAKNSSQYRELLKKAGEMYEYEVEQSKTKVISAVDDDENEFIVVSFFPQPSKKSENASEANLALIIRDGTVSEGELLIISETDDESEKYTTFQTDGGSITKDEETLEPSPKISSSSTPQYSPDQITLPINKKNCLGCLTPLAVICEYGCNVGASAVCAVVTGGFTSKFVCKQIVKGFCGFIEDTVQDTCLEASYVYCDIYCPKDPETYDVDVPEVSLP